MNLPVVTVLAGRAKRVRQGHPWVYSNEVQMDKQAKAIAPGALVRLKTENGESLGVAGFNPHTLIAARRLDPDETAVIDRHWFVRKFSAALALRQRFFKEPFFRLIHAEADGLPGLIVDLYGDVLVVQANTAVMDTLLPEILPALQTVTGVSTIVHNRAGAAVMQEGLAEKSEVLVGSFTGPLRIDENGASFFIDPIGGQKTGWFYDQRDNRAYAAKLCSGQRVLDAYCYAGGFGVLAATQAPQHVTLIDRSETALALARNAAEANAVTERCHFLKADALDELERLGLAGEKFGVVIADPPAFIKNKKDLGAGLRGYRKLARLAAAVVAPQGILCLGSCSYHAEPAAWMEENARGITEAGRTGRILRLSGAGADHPIHPLLPESAYLKFEVFQLD